MSDRRDSNPHSPFKIIKSPGNYYNRAAEDSYNEEEDEYPNFNNTLKNYFEKDDHFTVGQMFCPNDFSSEMVKKEPPSEVPVRNLFID